MSKISMNAKKPIYVVSTILASLAIIATLVILYCYMEGASSFAPLRKNIENDLSVGMNSTDVEVVLKKYGFQFRYYNNDLKYHGIIRNVDSCIFLDTAVEIELYVDEYGKLSKYSVFETSTLI